MVTSFKEFISGLIIEELHPEIKEIVQSKNKGISKQTKLVNKVKELTSRGEKTGIEGNMPKGSSRAYLKHEDSHKIILDGKPATIPIGTKVAIRASLDKHHDKKEYDGKSLGALQNQAEGGDHWVNNTYRILTQHPHKPNEFKSNHDKGIFPPLIDHDHEHHEWSQVGHIKDISHKDFKELTKTETHPNGISHKDFTSALERFHERNNGKYWEGNKEHEANLDHVENHPLVQKFIDYHGNTGNPPYDYRQIKNLGVFHHPDGPKHIIARDHGFDTEVSHAYRQARKKAAGIPDVLKGV